MNTGLMLLAVLGMPVDARITRPLGEVQPGDSVRVCVHDGRTQAPLVGVRVSYASGTSRLLDAPCGWVPTDSMPVRLQRVGYHPSAAQLPPSTSASAPFVVVLRPLGMAERASGEVTSLPTQQVTANAPTRGRAGGLSAEVTTSEARARGVTAISGLLAVLPYAALRSARGETGLQLRGARREQVVVTLDGLPLNDPATGVADVADVPLASLASVSVIPGADPLGAGSGAVGGVLALTTAAQRVLSVHTGAFGQQAVEGAWSREMRGARIHGAVAVRRAANDFAFVNDAGAESVTERRVNNDEQRVVVTGGMIAAGSQWHLLVSQGERGMVGAANVRAYDEDRSRTTRILLRGQGAVRSTLLTTGLRHFALHYRDPNRPELDSRSHVWSGDVEWRGSARVGEWRLGVGADALRGSGSVAQQRSRGFAAWSWRHSTGPASVGSARVGRRSPLDLEIGARTDAIERGGVQPTASIGATWRVTDPQSPRAVSLVARAAQAMRVPTLYDLYFAAPQRLAVRPLAPERVLVDGSSGIVGAWQRGGVRLHAEGSYVVRETRNAIVWFPGNFGWSPANVGRERLRGTEARAELAGARASAGVWHTWYDSRLRSGALDIPTPYVARQSGGAQAMWRIGAHAVSGNLRVQGRRPYTAGPRDRLFELPSVTTVDVAWSRMFERASTRALLSLALDNATDVRWQSVRGFPMPGRGWSASLTLQPRP